MRRPVLYRPVTPHASRPHTHRSVVAARASAGLAVALVGALTAVRLVLAATLGLGVDESYAVSIARPASAGYFDHPPLHFWIAAAAESLGILGIHGAASRAIALRTPFIVLGALSAWLLYRLTARLFTPRAGVWAVAALAVAPVFAIAGGSWVLPDGPLDAALLGAALCVAHACGVRRAAPADGPDALADPRAPAAARWWWIAAGACAGLALLSKYHGAFALAGALTFVATTPGQRAWLRRPAPYVGALLALACFAPVLAWNARHGWVSFAFQGGRASTGRPGLHLTSLLQSVAGQALWLGPWVWVPLVVAAWRAVHRGPRDPRGWLLCCFGLGPVLVFTAATRGGSPGLPHWQAPGYLLLLPLLGAMVDDALGRGRRWPGRWLAASAATFLVLVGVAATHTATGWLRPVLPRAFAAGDPSVEALDWRALPDTLRARGLLANAPVIVASTWIQAGKVAYALARDPDMGVLPVLCLTDWPHHFLYTFAPEQAVGRDALILTDRRSRVDVRARYGAHFDTLEPLAPVTIVRADRVEITLDVWRARRFRGHYGVAQPR